jgi:palmitoyltransferase
MPPREDLSRNVPIWFSLTKIFAAAIPSLTARSVGALDPEKMLTLPESTNLIIRSYSHLKDDLQLLNKLMQIARNLLVTSEPEIPQDLCAAVHFDQVVYQTMILAVNVVNKGFDADVTDDASKAKVKEIIDLCKCAQLHLPLKC